MKKGLCVVTGLLPLLLAACVQSAVPDTQLAQPTTPLPATRTAPLSTSTLAPSPTASPQPAAQRTQYTLAAGLDYAQHSLAVTESITYTNRSADALSELVLAVEPARQAGRFQLESVSLDGAPAPQPYTLTGEKLTLPLSQSLAPGGTVKVRLSFSIKLSSTPGVLSFDSAQVNLAGWYARIPPYVSGQGWLLHEPGAVGEYQVYELADFDVTLSVSAAPADLVVAASAPNDAVGGQYHYTLSAARTFTLSAGTDYVQLTAPAGSTRVTAYVFAGDEAAGEASLAATVQALQLYSRLFGVYTRPSLSVVEADFADGMEYDGLYFLGKEYFKSYKGSPASYLVTLSAHETAHQWWFGGVGNDQALEPWLDEALATYSERLFYENESPGQVDWWWQTRVQAYAPQGWVNSSIYAFSAFRPYVNAVYLRGAEFLEELRQGMGDTAFFAFLHGYYTAIQSQGQKDDLALATGSQFWNLLSQYTSTDLSGLKSRYFK